jgi:ATP-dependent Clp protease ATP-binding subunit ClpC
VFERFTERGRQVVVLAQEESRTLGHDYIGTEHILLGLLREEEGLAARVLASLGVTVELVRAEVVRIVGSGEKTASGQIPFTPRAKKVLELALRESRSLGHNYIGTEHILLGLVREEEGVAAQILIALDTNPKEIRDEMLRMLSSPEGAALRRSSGALRHRGRDVDGGRFDFTPAEAFELAERLTRLSSRITFDVRRRANGEPTFRVSCELAGDDEVLRELVALEAHGIRAVLDRDRSVRLGHLAIAGSSSPSTAPSGGS